MSALTVFGEIVHRDTDAGRLGDSACVSSYAPSPPGFRLVTGPVLLLFSGRSSRRSRRATAGP